jgi:quercetin 2,3-dioxygenase
MSKAKIVARASKSRGHANHGWLDTYHTFSFAHYHDSRHTSFGALRVLNEDRVAPHSGFPTHPHRDAEIFSYILSGELTHRDSMIKRDQSDENGQNKDLFYRMKRGDVQFTTGGTGIAHSEQNESDKPVHFLQIWAMPWRSGLLPQYHTKSFSEDAKRQAFLPILSPLKAGLGASLEEEKAAVPVIPDTIPIHADFVMGAGIIDTDKTFHWTVGGPGHDIVKDKKDRKVYFHLAMTKDGKAKVRVGGENGTVLNEGDGAYVSNVSVGDDLSVESVGSASAEVVVLDSNDF